MREINMLPYPSLGLTGSDSCALQYILLHLLGYQLTMDDLKQFRQLGSKTPGHPEAGHTDGRSYGSPAWLCTKRLI